MSDVSLREYLESQIKWVDRHFASQITTINEKTAAAKEQIDKRLEGMNEFRDALKDQASRLATKDEVAALKDSTNERLQVLELGKANFEGKVAVLSVLVASVVSILIVGISQFLR